jgi:predicted dehydrogenase
MKVGLIGYGSIGRRHVQNLVSLGYKDITLLREKGHGNEFDLKEEHDFNTFAGKDFSFIIISNPASFHYKTALPLIKANCNLLIEKPLVFDKSDYLAMKELISSYTGYGMVAYNMRFHPCIERIREIIGSGLLGRVYSSRLFVGQYLPEWRPDQDYRTGVSALKSLGGGVVFELIHEIDMAVYLFGKPVSSVSSVAIKSSDLEIETEDISEILFLSETNVIISIHQDYLNREYRRTIEIVGEKGTLDCDLKTSEIKIVSGNGKAVQMETLPFMRNDMYLNLVKYYTDCLINRELPVPDLNTALESVRIALEVKETNNLN